MRPNSPDQPRNYVNTSGFKESNILSRAIQIFRKDGLKTLFADSCSLLYKSLWPYLPENGELLFNDVVVGKTKLPDGFLPGFVTRRVPTTNPTYEGQYISCIREFISPGESIVVIGGGWGVSAVVAANKSKDGEVTVFEGSETEVQKIQRTIYLNGVSEQVDIEHAVIGEEVNLRGEAGNADYVKAQELPDCDTLLVDCDGAEFKILSELALRPQTLIVEHHAVFENGEIILKFKPKEVETLIAELGYDIVEKRVDSQRVKGTPEVIYVAEYSGS